ncbi:MAG: hypothetical protein ACRD3J_02045 [Thermoanaerobaculia bacterium]
MRDIDEMIASLSRSQLRFATLAVLNHPLDVALTVPSSLSRLASKHEMGPAGVLLFITVLRL